METGMLLTNLEYVPDRKILKHLGLVQGSTVRSKHVGRDLMAGIKNIFGGELVGYTELLQESREESMQRMIQQAEAPPWCWTRPCLISLSCSACWRWATP
jgi:uncharacterized protein YbjQ (UPF0145 family)